MRRSTLITRALGSTARVCAAVALSLVFVRHDAPAPRWDMIGALGAAAVTAGAWALACRAAPPLGAAPSIAGGRPPLPHRLPLPARDEARPYLTGTRPPSSDRAVRRPPRTAKFAASVHTRILGGALLAALLAAPVLYIGPDRLPALLGWLLCVSAAAALVVLALRGMAEATRSLPEGLSWTVQEESDPSIA